jgi:hypothetical protein
MSRTWGDELTLRACSDSFQVPIHVAGGGTGRPPSLRELRRVPPCSFNCSIQWRASKP